jgi:hypothetical protein
VGKEARQKRRENREKREGNKIRHSEKRRIPGKN